MSTDRVQLDKQPLFAAAILAALFSCAFLLLWWNRFLGGNGVDGNFFVTARLILEGKIPYRDFNLSVPPLEALKVAGLIRLFGDYLILPRAWGLVERVLFAAMLCVWLGRWFRAAPVFLATAAGMIVFCSAKADPLAGYNHSTSFWAVAAGFAASFLLEAQTTRAVWLCGTISGACAALSFLTKQTTGLGITLVIFTVVALSAWKKAGLPRAVRLILPYAAGWIVPVTLVGSWLLANHALGSFIDVAFVHGPASKGSPLESLLRPLVMTMQDAWLRQEALAAIALLIALWLAPRFARPALRGRSTTGQIVILFLIVAGVLAAAYVASTAGFAMRANRLISLPRIFLFLALFGGAATSLYYTWRWLRGQNNELDAQLWLLSGISFTAAYMHSLSFVTTESMTMPGAAFLLAWRLDRIGQGRLASGWTMPIGALCLGAIFCAATIKLATPYSWYGWTDVSVSQASTYSSLRQLRGIRMSPEAAAFAERLTALVDAHSTPAQPIYVFFYLPLGYALPERDPATFAYIHFIDVASDSVVRTDLAVLREHPPAVVVYTPVPEAELVDWEQLFRGGRPSGQRELIKLLDSMVASYKLLDTLHMPGSERAVNVYARY